MAKTEEALRAEVSGVCRNYCSQVWYETLNQAGVEASSMLRKTENVYYTSAIGVLVPLGLRIDTASKVAEVGKDSTAHVPTSSDNPSKEAEQFGATKKRKEREPGSGP